MDGIMDLGPVTTAAVTVAGVLAGLLGVSDTHLVVGM